MQGLGFRGLGFRVYGLRPCRCFLGRPGPDLRPDPTLRLGPASCGCLRVGPSDNCDRHVIYTHFEASSLDLGYTDSYEVASNICQGPARHVTNTHFEASSPKPNEFL